MFAHIMVPVDLAHEEKLGKSLKCAADLAQKWSAKITYIGVTGSAPSSLGHSPEEYRERLAKFAAVQGELAGVEATSHVIVSHDPAVDLNKGLLSALKEIGGDLVVMETHAPHIADYIWASHGGFVAEHASMSVMLVRGS